MISHKIFGSIIPAVSENHRFHLAAITFLAATLLLANLHIGGLSGYDDAFYAHEGRRMLASGDWWNVRFNGNLNFEYPPLFIWLEAASFFVFGISDFAAKLPSALLGLLTISLVFLLAKELSEDFWLPVISAWILMLSQYFMKYAMHAMTDVPFVFFFTLAVFAYVKALKKPHYFIVCGIAAALGIMTRSAIGLLPLAVIFFHLIVTKRFDSLRRPQFWAGLALASAIPAAWYIPQYQAHGTRFLTEHFAFITGKVASGKPFDLLTFLRGLVEYPYLLVKLYEPWIWLMLFGLFVHAKRAIRERYSASILLCLWVGFVIVPFSLAEAKVLRYVLAAFPAFSVLAATPLSGWLEKVKNKKNIAIVVFPNPRFRAEEMMKMSPTIQANVPENRRLVFYTGKDTKYDFHNQLLWYANRFTEQLNDEQRLQEKLYSNENLVFVMDKPNFQPLAADPRLRIKTLAETENFVCFEINAPD